MYLASLTGEIVREMKSASTTSTKRKDRMVPLSLVASWWTTVKLEIRTFRKDQQVQPNNQQNNITMSDERIHGSSTWRLRVWSNRGKRCGEHFLGFWAKKGEQHLGFRVPGNGQTADQWPVGSSSM
uniref:Uncharacterized protein n=1 Tax=Pristionchus pacificus TaxID=54126 RepID=A0A2A6CWR8_PRIPA|eukprot:PDM82684.1 hypothetical protein PRIPAC_37077 [Pristionchus pacificus]